MTTTPYAPPPPPTQPPPPVPGVTPPPQKSGCLKWGLIGCSVVVVLFAVFCVVVVVFAFGAMKRTDVYKGALNRAQNDPRVVAALGSPVEGGWWIKGSVNRDMQHGGNAELTFPVSGPKAHGTEHVVATFDGDKWTFERLTVTPDGGAPIDLNTPP